MTWFTKALSLQKYKEEKSMTLLEDKWSIKNPTKSQMWWKFKLESSFFWTFGFLKSKRKANEFIMEVQMKYRKSKQIWDIEKVLTRHQIS